MKAGRRAGRSIPEAQEWADQSPERRERRCRSRGNRRTRKVKGPDASGER